jgi:hypothetical protein
MRIYHEALYEVTAVPLRNFFDIPAKGYERTTWFLTHIRRLTSTWTNEEALPRGAAES